MGVRWKLFRAQGPCKILRGNQTFLVAAILLHDFACDGVVYEIIIIIIMTRRQLRSVATTLHDDRDPVPSSTPV